MSVTSPPDLTPAAARLERAAPGYLDRVRQATARLAARPGNSNDPRVALEALGDVATIDVEVPTASTRRSVSLLKRGTRRFLGWYLRYVGGQVTVLGQATTRLGAALVERTEQLGDETAKLQRDIQVISDRLDALERGGR
jgi:hypothetical protein